MRPRRQLAVGECAGAALPELDVALAVERPALPKGLHGGAAGVHVAAALYYDRAQAGAGEEQRGEHPRRAEAHDHRAMRAGSRGDRIDIGRVG